MGVFTAFCFFFILHIHFGVDFLQYLPHFTNTGRRQMHVSKLRRTLFQHVTGTPKPSVVLCGKSIARRCGEVQGLQSWALILVHLQLCLRPRETA